MESNPLEEFKLSGRGAWSNIGGTLSVDGTKPGVYYRTPATGTNWIGKNIDETDQNQRAVKAAVKAYQAALNRRISTNLLLDGVLGPVTSGAISNFQAKAGEYVDGVIGPKTSKSLLLPDLQKAVRNYQTAYPGHLEITWVIVCGVITNESGWDAGAVGYVDDEDLGLAQINGPSHEQYTEAQRLDPLVAFPFVFNYLRESLDYVSIVTIDDAIASYNLGVGGASSWIKAGRPDIWKPTPTSAPRDVRGYINRIKTACSA
jgi:hypothetical protein